MRTLLNEWDGWRAYDQIWFPDDDILASGDTLTRMFDVAAAVGLYASYHLEIAAGASVALANVAAFAVALCKAPAS